MLQGLSFFCFVLFFFTSEVIELELSLYHNYFLADLLILAILHVCAS